MAVVCGLLAAVLLATVTRYGPHRDELYFAATGHHLAWGYPDQPSFTPLLAGLADAVAPGSLVALRLPSLLAMVALVLCAVGFARLLGGGTGAQTLTAVVVAASALTLTLGHRLSTATFDTLAWTAVLLVVGHALVHREPRWWLLAGLIAGVGLNNKHAVAILLFALLVAVAVLPESRWSLRTPWPWVGGLLAALLWLPNLVWQAAHGWPVRALSADIAAEYGGVGGRIGLVTQALLMFSPLIALVWLYGLVLLLRRREWRPLRPIGLAVLVVAAVFLVAGGKGYYLAGAIVPLVAAGCVGLALRLRTRGLTVAGIVLALSAMAAWPAMVPLLPVRTYAASFYPAIDADQLETIGWHAYVDQVRTVLDGLPPDRRAHAVVLTRNYGEAGALQWYGVDVGVYSGHNAYGDWGPPPADAGPVVAVGERWDQTLAGCRRVATVTNAVGADNEERGVPIWTCTGPRGSWAQAWPSIRHLSA